MSCSFSHIHELLSGLDINYIRSNVRTLLMKAVEKRLMTQQKVGCFLSGITLLTYFNCILRPKRVSVYCGQRIVVGYALQPFSTEKKKKIRTARYAAPNLTHL